MDEYTVDINGVPHTLLLTEEEAERRGATKTAGKAATAPNKARTPKNKES